MTTTRIHRSDRRTRRRPLAAFVAAATVLAACGGGSDADTGADGDETETAVASGGPATTDESTTTSAPRSGDSVRSSVRSDGDGFSLEVESSAAEIWALTNRDDVCSPNEPAVAVFEASLDGVEPDEIDGIRAFFERDEETDEDDDDEETTTSSSSTTTTTSSIEAATTTTVPSSRARTIDFAVDEDDVWRAVVGPIRATNRNDRPLAVTVVAQTSDGDRAETELDLTVLAPIPCGSGERPGRNRPTPEPVELTVSRTPSDGVIVGAERDDCAGRPTQLTVNVNASGAVVAMTASGTLPDGTSVARSMEGRGSRDFSVRLGPFPSPESGETASVRFTVSATDVFGTTVQETVSAVLARPEPCDDPDATTTTVPDGDEPVADSDRAISVSFSPDPPLVQSSGQGQCPTGPTTLGITFSGPSSVTAVSVTTRTANGQTSTVTLTGSGGSWSGTLGPFAGWSGMATTSDLGVRITATVDGETKTLDETARLRRADPCGSSTTAPATTAATTTTTTTAGTATTTTTAPSGSTTTTTTTTTTTSTSTTTTTTAPPPAPPQITNAAANPNPVACGATVTIGAQTTGSVTQVGANVGGNTQALSGGGGSWTRSFTAPATRQQLSVTIRADGPGGSDQRSFTLNVDC